MKKEQVTQDFRNKRKIIQKNMWQNKEYKENMIKKHLNQKAWNKGIPLNKILSESTNNIRKNKIAKTLKKLYKTGKRKAWNIGLTAKTNKSIAVMVNKVKGVPRLDKKGDKNFNWKGGVTPMNKLLRRSIPFKLWRESVFERDNYICQVCGNRGGKLAPHHINRFSKFPKERFEINNGITCCNGSCHKQLEKLSLETEQRTIMVNLNV